MPAPHIAAIRYWPRVLYSVDSAVNPGMFIVSYLPIFLITHTSCLVVLCGPPPGAYVKLEGLDSPRKVPVSTRPQALILRLYAGSGLIKRVTQPRRTIGTLHSQLPAKKIAVDTSLGNYLTVQITNWP